MSNEAKIAELAKQRNADGLWKYGRRAINKMYPEVSEWKIRRIIETVRGVGTRTTPAPTPEQEQRKVREMEQLSIPKIVIRVPKVAAKKADSSATKSVKHWLVVSDHHAPYQHEPSCEITYAVGSDLKPEKIVLLGDIINLDLLSKYDHVPSNPNTWIDDITNGGVLLGNYAQVSPGAELEWFVGNHEERLKKYLMRHDPQFYDLLDLQKIFMLVGYDNVIKQWKFVSQPEVYHKDLNLVLAHGMFVRSTSGMSGKAHTDYLQISTIVGHSHRLGLYYHTTGRSRYTGESPVFAIENGCLCRYDLPYTGGKTLDWQHGFTVLTIDESGPTPRVEPEIVKIVDGKAIFRGKVYKA